MSLRKEALFFFLFGLAEPGKIRFWGGPFLFFQAGAQFFEHRRFFYAIILKSTQNRQKDLKKIKTERKMQKSRVFYATFSVFGGISERCF